MLQRFENIERFVFCMDYIAQSRGAILQSHQSLRGAYYVFLCNIVTRGYNLVKTKP